MKNFMNNLVKLTFIESTKTSESNENLRIKVDSTEFFSSNIINDEAFTVKRFLLIHIKID